MKKNYPLQRACRLLSNLITQAKMFSLLLASLLVMQQTPVIAKDSEAQIRISVNAYQESVKEVLREIEKQSGMKFVYLTDQVDDDRKVTLQLKNVLLSNALETLFSGTSIAYEKKGKKILLKRIKSTDQSSITDGLSDSYEIQVSGKVTDESNQPLPGVNILVKGTTNGTTSDNEGNYSINVPDQEAMLVFSFIGYSSQEIKVGSQSQINIVLLPDIKSLQEVVVVGYGTQKKVNLTGSVSSVNSSELENRPITQASQALAGLAAGVSVSQGSGRPGNDGSSITIRGMGTFSGAGNSPLVLIDGLASSINEVDPNNIKSISVLKDAASASIYGTRAANGVILIETKRGKEGKLSVSYNNYFGWQKVTELPDFVQSHEFAALRNEANGNMGQGPTYSDEDIAKFKSGEDPDNYPNVPHLKNLLTSGSGFQSYHNVSLTGGDTKNSFLFAFGYLDQNGVVKENDYDKYNVLLNFDSKIRENLRLSINLSGNTANTDEPRQYDGELVDMIRYAVREGPIYAGKKSNGTYGYQDNFSPEAWLDSKSFTNRKNKYFLGGAQLSWEVFKGFTLSGKAGYNYTNFTNNSYASTFTFDQFKTVGPNNLRVRSGDSDLLTLQSLAQYSRQMGQHNFTVLAGFSQEEFRQDWIEAYRDKFPNDMLYELDAAAASNMQSRGAAMIQRYDQVNIYTTNHDLIVERILLKSDIKFNDGFAKTNTELIHHDTKNPIATFQNSFNKPGVNIIKVHGSIDMIRYTKNDVVDGNLTYTGYLYFKPESRDEMHYPARINVNTSEIVQTPPNTILPMFITGVDKLKRLLGDEMYSVLMDQMNNEFSLPADVLIVGYSYSDDHINEAIKKIPRASPIRNVNPSAPFPFDDFKNVKNFKIMEAEGALG